MRQEPRPHGGEGGEEALERVGVQLPTPRAFALEANQKLDLAPADALPKAVPQGPLLIPKGFREAKGQVEESMIDAAQLEGEGHAAQGLLASGIAGHAFDPGALRAETPSVAGPGAGRGVL